MENRLLTDDMLKDAVNAAFILDELDHAGKQENAEDVAFSEDFQDRFDLLLQELDQQETGKEQIAAKKKIHFRRAVIIAAAVLTSLLAVGAAFASWNRWLELEKTSTDTALKWEKNSTKTETIEMWDWQYLYLPTELPQGYVKLDQITQLNEIIITYGPHETDVDKFITYLQYKELGYFSVDNEGTEVSEVFIGKNKGTLIQKENENVLFWNNGDFAFCIYSKIPVPDLMYFAEHLEKTKPA